MGSPQFTDPETHAEVHGPAIADLSGGTYTGTTEDAINAILAALRSANIIASS